MVVLVLPAKEACVAPTDTKSLTLSALRQRHIAARSLPFVVAPAAGWFFYTITFVALLAVHPAMVLPEQRSFMVAALPIASILSSIALGVVLLQWCSAVVVVIIGFSLAIGIALLLALSPDTPWVSIALFAALGLVQGAIFASVPELNLRSADQALANGAPAQTGNIGNAFGTPLLLMLLAVGDLYSVQST